MNAVTAKPVRSREELEASIRGLTDADWVKLAKTGRYHAARCRWDGDDLVQEALMRAVAGTRECPADVEVIAFLIMTIRGIATDEAAKPENRDPRAIVTAGEPVPGAEELRDARLNAEQQLLKAADLKEVRETILLLFDDDPVAHDLVDGVMANMSKAELCEVLSLDDTTYASKRRLIRRRIDKMLEGV